MAESLDSLRAQLAELKASWPELPRPFDPNSKAAIRYQRQVQQLVDRKALLEAKINAALCPVEFGNRERRPLAALRPAPVRLRQ